MDVWGYVQFTEEDEIVNTGSIGSDGECNRFSLCLLESLWTESPYNVWKLHHGVEVKDNGKNLFTFQFFHY